MKCVFLDCAIINPGDISWEKLQSTVEFEYYDRTAPDQIAERLKGAEGVFIDGTALTREIMESCPDLKYIGIAATGYNHVDLDAAKELGIAVTNVSGYAADAVAQHAIALLLYITNKIQIYNNAIADGEWNRAEDYTFIKAPLTLLAGKSIGIVGYGAIGKRVAEIAEALGMTVNIYSRDREAAIASDVLSLNCPLTKENAGMIDAAEAGTRTLEQLEAMTAVCSVGLDMIVLPGDTPADTISAIIADEAAIGMVNSKTTAVRVIPAIGHEAGEVLDFGGLLGTGPIMKINRKSSSVMIQRGGRIPAPMQSLKN